MILARPLRSAAIIVLPKGRCSDRVVSDDDNADPEYAWHVVRCMRLASRPCSVEQTATLTHPDSVNGRF